MLCRSPRLPCRARHLLCRPRIHTRPRSTNIGKPKQNLMSRMSRWWWFINMACSRACTVMGSSLLDWYSSRNKSFDVSRLSCSNRSANCQRVNGMICDNSASLSGFLQNLLAERIEIVIVKFSSCQVWRLFSSPPKLEQGLNRCFKRPMKLSNR
jgi:hypothetical protein